MCKRENLGTKDVLPKSKSGCCVPKLVDLGRVVLDELLVVNHEEGVGWNIFWEGR